MLATTIQSQNKLREAEAIARDVYRHQYEQALSGLITNPNWDYAISDCDYTTDFGVVRVQLQVDFDGVVVVVTDEFGQQTYAEDKHQALENIVSVIL